MIAWVRTLILAGAVVAGIVVASSARVEVRIPPEVTVKGTLDLVIPTIEISGIPSIPPIPRKITIDVEGIPNG